MLLTETEFLSERAAYNCIDLSGYLHYPRNILRSIVIAMEQGCSKRQIDKVLTEYKNRDIPGAIKKLIGVPDIDYYTETLTKYSSDIKFLDLREELKVLDFLLPENDSHSWKTKDCGLSKQMIVDYVQKEEFTASCLLPYFFAIDQLIDKKEHIFKHAIADMWEYLFKDEDMLMHYPDTDEMRTLCYYIAASGLPRNEAVRLSGLVSSQLGFQARETYSYMLETAAVYEVAKKGITAGINYIRNKELPIKYEITEIGLFQKRFHAEPCREPPLLMKKIIETGKQGEKHETERFFLDRPDKSQVMAFYVFSRRRNSPEDFLKELSLQKKDVQYAEELLLYTKRRR